MILRTHKIGEPSVTSVTPSPLSPAPILSRLSSVPTAMEIKIELELWNCETDTITSRSLLKKSWLVFCIMLITTSVYIGSSIYSPAIVAGAEYFGVSEIVSILGLSLFGMSPVSCCTPHQLKVKLTKPSGRVRYRSVILGSHYRDTPDRTEFTIYRPARYFLYTSSTHRLGR